MADLTLHAKAFASPGSGDAPGAVRPLAAGRLHGTRRRVAEALARAGVDAAARSVLAFTAGAGSAWRPETGLALQAHRAGDHALAALQLGAAYAATGGGAAIEVSLDAPTWLYLDGWLMPVEGRARLTTDAGAITVRSERGGATYTLYQGNTWIPDEAPGGPWRPHPSGGMTPRYVTASGLRHSIEGFPWISAPPSATVTPASPASPVSPEQRIAALHAGWRLILDRAPAYAAWVASTAAGCLLLESSDGVFQAQSGSSYDHPGLIAVEPPECPVFCGEILVHECSHQHMLVYTMVVPLVRPGSAEVHFSPIKRARRTIDRVLSGAHAVGNMILYYEAVRRSMALDPASQERFEQHRAWFAADYRPALDASESLTAAGRDLWQALCRAVDAAARAPGEAA